MPDERPRATVDRPVNLSQLDAELGSPGLTARLDDAGVVVEVVAPASVGQQRLGDAVAAHVAVEPEQLPSYAELVAEVRGIRDRAAAADVTSDDARVVRDAVAGR